MSKGIGEAEITQNPEIVIGEISSPKCNGLKGVMYKGSFTTLPKII